MYINIERLYSGDISAFLGSVESNDEGHIENIMNDSDTEFAPEDELVISTNIIRKEEVMTEAAPYQFQKHQSTFCLPKTKMKPIL